MNTYLNNTSDIIDSIRQQVASGRGDWWQALQEGGHFSDRDIVQALSDYFKLPEIDLETLQSSVPVFDLMPLSSCRVRDCVIITHPSHCLVMVNPFDNDLIAWAGYAYAGCNIKVCSKSDLDCFLAWCENKVRSLSMVDTTQGKSDDGDVTTINLSLESATESEHPVIKLVNSILYDALNQQVSDIHIETDHEGLTLKYRIDGVLSTIRQIQGADLADQVIARIKVLSELDTAERRIPQDGRFKARAHNADIDFRVSIMPNVVSEDAVLRLLDRRSLTDKESALTLEVLKFDPAIMAAIRRLVAKPHGLVLVTGPTGSGKTTTLYAALTEVNTGEDKLITIEDPVEYRLSGILQIPVNERKGLTFARGLRSILRHDPDKIMVGEIRDSETAEIAVQASLTGHLVLSTLHANNVYDVISRVIRMGIDPYSFASSINGVIGQRLIRVLCQRCCIPDEPSEASLQEIGVLLSDITGQVYQAVGCEDCRGSGYKGRRSLAEILVFNDVLRDLVIERAPISRLKEEGARSGMISMMVTIKNWLNDGVTSVKELRRVMG